MSMSSNLSKKYVQIVHFIHIVPFVAEQCKDLEFGPQQISVGDERAIARHLSDTRPLATLQIENKAFKMQG